MLNEEIIKAGYANIMVYPPNARYQDRSVKAYKEAKSAKCDLYRLIKAPTKITSKTSFPSVAGVAGMT
jgi:endonuclease YncB( thermonuclease family)